MTRWYTAASALLLLSACGSNDPSPSDTVVQLYTEPAVAQQPVVFADSDVETASDGLELAKGYSYESCYDGQSIDYWLREPQMEGPNTSLIVLMGDKDSLTPLELSCPEHWLLYIPSRPQLNYQLVSEGDFWKILERCKGRQPELAQLPCILVGHGKAANVALNWANNYRAQLNGVVLQGPITTVDVPNLDSFPLVALRENLQQGLWTASHLVHRLQERNNPYAAVLQGEIPDAVDFLSQQLDEVAPPLDYQFRDYRFAQAWPWLRVTSKNNEAETAKIHAYVDGNTLYVEGDNIASVELQRGPGKGFPSQVTQVRFNDDLYLIPKSDPTVAIGNEDYPEELKRKADSPSAFVNFWRSEPLVIVHQDTGESAAFLAATKNLAKNISRLQFKGFPQLDISLPIIPLSAYRPEFHTAHRVIYVGTPDPFIPIVESRGDDYPIQWQHQRLTLGQKNTEISAGDTIAYGLTLVPDDDTSLKAALILAAQDLQGLQALTECYTSATSLFKEHDLQVWVKNEQHYELAVQHNFDSYWGNTHNPTTAVTIPRLSNKVWEGILAEWLMEESQYPERIGEQFLNPSATPPQNFSVDQVQRFIPNRNYARLVLNSEKSIEAINHILEDNPLLEIHHCDDLLSYSSGHPRFDRDHLHNERVVIVDSSALETLPATTLRQLNYELLPHNLHEIIEEKAKIHGQRFGRELLRTAQTLYPTDEVVL